MMRSWTLAYVLLIAGAASAQEPIPWTADRALEWSDFNAKVPAGTDRDAYTYYGIQASWEQDAQGVVKANVECVFLPDKSWVRPEAKHSALLLTHERLHFDIAELHARAFREELPALVKGSDPERAFKAAHDRRMKALNEEQRRYDQETDHGRNEVVQGKWAERIAVRLR
ncbi:MAG: DUF922 domain-containing protein [Flavobacteriales bacterium]|nr:DUF922 domain-containing protein [Flavobacteriales bacterium]MBK9074881.1 DUF922 domain-containing protein [Flavobacteriales bacterium]MBK9538898.1 DUF922 domain-containing protein [Flavobacteriales bacterium]